MANDNYITGILNQAASIDGYQGQNGQMAGGAAAFTVGALFSPIENASPGAVWANLDVAGLRGWEVGYVWDSGQGALLQVRVGGGTTLDVFALGVIDSPGAVVHAVVRFTAGAVKVYVAGTPRRTFTLTDPSVAASPKAPTVGFADSAVPEALALGSIIHGMWYEASALTDGQIAEHYRRCTAAFDMAGRASFFLPLGVPDFTNRFSARDAVAPGVRAISPLALPPPQAVWPPRAGNISLTRRDSLASPPLLGTIAMKNPMWASVLPTLA